MKEQTGGGEKPLKQPNVSLTAAEAAEQPQTAGEETGIRGSKPANGTPESSSNSQSGAGKKVGALRASFHSAEARNTDLIAVHQSAVALQAAVLQQIQAEQQRGAKPGGGVPPRGCVPPGGASARRCRQTAAARILCTSKPSLRNLQRPVILLPEPGTRTSSCPQCSRTRLHWFPAD